MIRTRLPAGREVVNIALAQPGRAAKPFQEHYTGIPLIIA